MEELKKEMLNFAEFLSGIQPSEKRPIRERPFLSESEPPHTAAWQNEWVMQVYESVIQLLKVLKPENVNIIGQRFKKIKKDYYELRNQPKTTTSGLNSQYERAFNKKYYY